MKIYLFRHGAVEKSGEQIFLGRTDLPLSKEGRGQARAWLAHLGGRLTGRIAASPLSRALKFAAILAGERAAEVETVPAFSEIDLGEWDGRAMARVRRTDPEAWQARGNDMERFRPPGGESFADVHRRAVPAFEKLAAETGTDLFLVCHAGVNRVILCHLLGMPLQNLFRLGQKPGCLNLIERRGGRFQVAAVNRVLDCGASAHAL